jgi:hypothetical protein
MTSGCPLPLQYGHGFQTDTTSNEILLVFENLGDVAVGSRRFLDELPQEVLGVDHATHRLSERVGSNASMGFFPTHDTSGAVRTRSESGLDPTPFDDVARRSHRSRYKRVGTGRDGDGSLPMHEQLTTQPDFAGDEVVVNIETVLGVERHVQHVGKDFQCADLDCIAVCSGKVESPREIVEVRGASLARDVQASEFTFAAIPSSADMVVRHGGAEAPRPGMNKEPQAALRVSVQFEKVVTSPERA